ncbi:hypothetical protein AB0A63_26745 [Lentzea sp. NPDC042327]|uniref:hypothetical protein n=1 Tax=Lentzea sp. NPDC042327 TaxID=3154801 RepID=UPI0033F43792
MRVFRHLATSLAGFSALVAAGVFVFTVALTFAVSLFKDVVISGWSVAAGQVGPWFVLFVGVHVIHNVLPVAVAHGRTRRELLGAATGFSVVFAAAMAAVAWLGFAVEGGVYALMDWTAGDRGLPHAYFLMYLVWCAVGMLLAAAFDTSGLAGLVALPFGIAFAVMAKVRIPGSGELPFLRNEMSLLGAGWHVASAVAWLLAVAATWLIAKNMPVRSKSA